MEVKSLHNRQDRVREFLRKHRLGMVALVFTDIIGSTDLKRNLGDHAAVLLIQQHHSKLRELLADFSEAEEIETAGDSFFVVFSKPSDAVRFALMLQSVLRVLTVEAGVRLADRIGVHVGEVFIEERQEAAKRKDLFGIQVDTCARVTALAGGDQILMTRFAFDNARQILLGQELPGLLPLRWLKHGLYQLKGVEEPLEICEVGEQGRAALEAPGDTEKAKRHVDEHLKRAGWRPAAGEVVPHSEWVLVSKLGEGGFGEVWHARHRETGEEAAYKFSFRDAGKHLLEQAWNIQQAFLQRNGKHAGIVKIFEAHLNEQPCALRMELIRGCDLAVWCAARGGPTRLPLGLRVEIVTQLAEIMQQAHVGGMTHNDLKPSNILVTDDGTTGDKVSIKLTDFGVRAEDLITMSDSSQTSILMGSPLYLSPEQARGDRKIGPASDIYALGVILYELLTGRPPFVRASMGEVLTAHRYEDPRLPIYENPDIPDGLQRICLKAMEKRSTERYDSAKEMASDLRRFTCGEHITVRPSQYDNMIASRIRRHLEELTDWRRDQLLTDHEFASLAGAYSRFDRAGLEAVMETRRVHAWLLLLLLGGWLLLDGSSLWLTVQWSTLSTWKKICLGWYPLLISNGLWAVFWRYGSYRAAYIMMLLGAISFPFGIVVLLDALHWWETNLGTPCLVVGPVHNAQELAALVAAVVWTALLMWRTRTVSVSTLCTAFALGAYAVILDFCGLDKLVADHLATLALRTIPMAAAALVVGSWLGRKRSRRRQSIPWFTAALVLLVTVTLTVAWAAPTEWLNDKITGKLLISPEAVAPLQGLLIAVCAGIYFPAGLILRHQHLVSARKAYGTLLCLSPVCLLSGVVLMSCNWPETWFHETLFGQQVPLPDLWLILLSVICLLAASSVQIRFFAFAGLTALTIAEWRIGLLYVTSQNKSWAVSLLTCGTLLITILVTIELQKRRKQAKEDMDDVAERLASTSRSDHATTTQEDW